MHVPSFRHGLLEHSFTSRKKIVVGLSYAPVKNMNFYRHHSRENKLQGGATNVKGLSSAFQKNPGDLCVNKKSKADQTLKGLYILFCPIFQQALPFLIRVLQIVI